VDVVECDSSQTPHVHKQSLGSVGDLGWQTGCGAAIGAGRACSEGEQGKRAGKAQSPSWQPN